MSRSLQQRLSAALAGAILLAGLLAALVSFYFSYSEAQEFQDDTLRQVAVLAKSSPAAAPASSAESDSRIVVIHSEADRPSWLPGNLKPGLHTLTGDDDPMRVFVGDWAAGQRIVIAQATEVRDEIALHSTLRTLIPTLALIPLLVWLSMRIVRRVFRPVRELGLRVDSQPAAQPGPLPTSELPDEIASFVHAINRLLERVNRLMNDQRRFVADAAHELRSPLTAIAVQVRNLRNAESMEAMRDRLTAVDAGVERANHLTEQLLSLARSQAATLELTTVDVSALVRELIGEHWDLAHAKGIDLGMEERVHMKICAAPDALRLILKNALDNALRYTPSNGEVTVRLGEEGNDAVIDIIDNGPGVAVAERERVFDPFFRVAGSSGEGSGLGLAIARDAAERLGGTVSLTTRSVGSGLVFRYRQARKH